MEYKVTLWYTINNYDMKIMEGGSRLNSERNPQIIVNRNYYIMEKQIVVLGIFETVHLVKVKCIDNSRIMIVDVDLLSINPMKELSISVKVLGGFK